MDRNKVRDADSSQFNTLIHFIKTLWEKEVHETVCVGREGARERERERERECRTKGKQRQKWVPH